MMDTQKNILREYTKEQLESLGIQATDPLPEPYQELPEELWAAAKAKLAQEGTKVVQVSRTSGGKLSRWAASQRKAKRKAATNSRRKNQR